jgi:hypothetical protein
MTTKRARVSGAAPRRVEPVLRVVAPSAEPQVSLPDGTSARVVGEAIELRDPGGRLLVRYSDGNAEIAAPSGDLRLSAPTGRVVLHGGTAVELGAGECLSPRLCIEEGQTTVAAKRLEVEAEEARVVAKGPISVLAQQIATSAEVLSQNAVRFELTATRLVEKTRDAFRETSELAQTRVGRARLLVSDVYSLFSRRTTMVSNEETSIDGSKILLG